MAKSPITYRSGDKIESTVPPSSLPGKALWLAKEGIARVARSYPGAEPISGQGTLTCFALDEHDRPVLLSCSHVIFPGFVALPDMHIYSPDYSACCSSGDPIARPVFDRAKPAQPDGGQGLFAGWFGGYKDGKWYGGFNAKSRPMSQLQNQLIQCTQSDCAIGRLDADVHFKNVWPDGTIIKGAVPPGELGAIPGPAFGTTPSPAQYVRVYSPRLGKVIHGTVLSYPASAAPIYREFEDPLRIVYPASVRDDSDAASGTKPLVDHFLILPRPAPGESYDSSKPPSFDHEDSGAVVINHQNLVIAMIVRAMKLDNPRGKIFEPEVIQAIPELRAVDKIGHAALIGFALERLKIKIPSDPGGWGGVTPAGGTSATRVLVPGLRDDHELAAQRAGAERLRAALLATRRGRVLVGKVGQHRRELRRLLATVRAISSAWHELQGAAYLHHALTSMRDPEHIVPNAINGVTRARLADVMIPLLARHGSAALRRDLDRHGPWVIAALLDVSTLDELPSVLAPRRPVA